MPQSFKATSLLGITHPVIQGPFGGGLSSVALTSTVSNLGGLGSFGAHHLSPPQLRHVIQEIRQHTDKPFAMNLWIKDADEDGMYISKEKFEETYHTLQPYFEILNIPKPSYPEQFGQKFEHQIEVILQEKPPVFSFVYGIPSKEILHECKKRDIITIGTAITPDEAGALDDAGVDAIVATGFEAGGHRVAFLREAEDSLFGTFSLIPQVRKLTKRPVIAAGGIASAEGVKAALMLGADAVQVGTAFLACEESNAPSVHKDILFSSQARQTSLTRIFTGRLARGIHNKIMKEQHLYAPYPAQSWFMSHIKNAAVAQQRPEFISLWAGQSASLLHHRTAKDVFCALIEGL
jgi:nitronate monooxygenase